MMKCKFEHDGDCCNCASQQYMCKCKPKICGMRDLLYASSLETVVVQIGFVDGLNRRKTQKPR